MNIIKKTALYLLSQPYAMCVAVRNKLYDTRTLESKKTIIPTIGVGNITMGGTGKTPHSEYIIELLKDRCNVAYLSRGYKRKTSGYYDTIKKVTAKIIGDEAYQIHSNFPDIVVAVCENRNTGIENIKKFHPKTDVVVLDDVYQHRQISPDINILLIDYNRLVYRDHILPLGALRESVKNTDRADIIIITKCPKDIRPVDCLSVRSQIEPYPYQKLMFSEIQYKELVPLYDTPDDIVVKDKCIIAVSGLATSKNYVEYLKTLSPSVLNLNFNDHHNYNEKSINIIEKELERLDPEKSIVVITEKDKAKLDALHLPDVIRQRIFCLGIRVNFIFDGQKDFDHQILKVAGGLK